MNDEFSCVGLDLSLTATGFAIKKGNKVEWETLKTSPKKHPNYVRRYRHIATEILRRIPKNCSMIFLEDYFMPDRKERIQAAMRLVALSSVVRHELLNAGYPFMTASPTQLKKFIRGKGAGNKKVMMRWVEKRWGIKTADDNQSDAVGLAYSAELLYLMLSGMDYSHYEGFQVDLINKIFIERERTNFNDARDFDGCKSEEGN